jgi:hypothetical protein
LNAWIQKARAQPATAIGWVIVGISAVIYWLAARGFDAGRGDFFYLADAFLHGRTWLDFRPGANDVIVSGARFYVPFAPFPAVALMPVVAILGAAGADQVESGINALLAASGVGLCWMLLGRIGVRRLTDRFALIVLFGFSTQILWVTTRGGVWHTGHLIATILTFACLIELWGRRRAWLIGLMAGAAFLTRAPLAFGIPFYALLLADGLEWQRWRLPRSFPWRHWLWLSLGTLPSVVAFFAYNEVRFGSPFESGYALATLPGFLEVLREHGLFSIAHVLMNLNYFLVHLPFMIPKFPYVRPDGLGLSVLITSPGLLFAVRADWRASRSLWLLGAAILVLIPSLLYYGGGWLQYGYRYFLDSVPFVIALCGQAAVRQGRIARGWLALIALGTVVMAFGVYWAYRI